MTRAEAIVILQTTELPADAERVLSDRFELVRLPIEPTAREATLARVGPRVRATAGSGKSVIDASMLSALPNLELISVTSAGLDAIDSDEVARQGIPIFNTSAILAADVADLAIWLILSTTRNLVQADRFVREGRWSQGAPFPLGRTTADMRVGILGLGHIGTEIARRVALMGAEIGYTGRSAKPEVTFPYFPDVQSLAHWCDLLVVACPATPQTTGLVDAAILRALGRDGILVNIARGSVVNEAALVAALDTGEILAVGLDVFAAEPDVPLPLRENPRAILLPHIGSATLRTRERMWQAMVDALLRHFGLPPQEWARES